MNFTMVVFTTVCNIFVTADYPSDGRMLRVLGKEVHGNATSLVLLGCQCQLRAIGESVKVRKSYSLTNGEAGVLSLYEEMLHSIKSGRLTLSILLQISKSD